MAIHGSEQKQGTSTISSSFSDAGQETIGRANTSQEKPRGQSAGFSWDNIQAVGSHAMRLSPMSEVLTQTLAALDNQFKSQNVEHYEVRLVPMDMKDYNRLPTSIIAVTLRDKSVSNPMVSVHILILEGSVEPWGAITENINGVAVNVQRPTSEAYKQGIDSVVADEVTRQFPNARLLLADAAVVPRTFDLTDKRAVYSLAANALLACESRLFEEQADRAQINIALANNESSLSARTNFLGNQAQQLDPVGLPLRSDIEISIISTRNQNPSMYGQQLLERQRDIGYVTGFIDTIWDPVVTNTGFGAQPQYGQYQQLAADGSQPTAKVRGLFVITDSRIQELSSLTAQIFSILPSLLLRENNFWQAAFRPRANVEGKIDTRNVGALNIEANLPIVNGQPDPSGRGSLIDIHSANFNEQHFHNFMQAVFRPGLGIAIDVPECGASTWYNNIFLAAAIGNQEAYNAIYDATDFLTGGHFSKLFQRGQAIAMHYSVIHNGWYVDQTNQRRDIRDFDLISLLNHPQLSEDPQVVDAWIASMQDPNIPIKIRLHHRWNIINKAFSEVHQTGFSNRIILENEFLTAALKAAGQAGLVLRPQNQYMDQGVNTRVSSSLNAGLFGMGGGTGVFNNTLNNTIGGQGNGMLGGFAGRFGRV